MISKFPVLNIITWSGLYFSQFRKSSVVVPVVCIAHAIRNDHHIDIIFKYTFLSIYIPIRSSDPFLISACLQIHRYIYHKPENSPFLNCSPTLAIIWVNQNMSLTWIKAMKGMISFISYDSRARSRREVVI